MLLRKGYSLGANARLLLLFNGTGKTTLIRIQHLPQAQIRVVAYIVVANFVIALRVILSEVFVIPVSIVVTLTRTAK